MPIILLLLFIPVFWLLIVRPQQRQRRAHMETVASLQVGDRVMTVGGLIGTLTQVGPETVRLDPGGGTELAFGRTFVRQKMAEEMADPLETIEGEPAAPPVAAETAGNPTVSPGGEDRA